MNAIPPTLAAPSARALAHGLLALLRPSAYEGELERQLGQVFPPTSVVPYATGRAALAAALQLAMRATGRRTVVLPAYTSYSVAAAAAVAGARVRLCDVEPGTLDFERRDLRSCVDGNTAAVVLGNLYGYPSGGGDISWIRSRGALVIDDAAQALGGVAEDGPVGWRGDLGVLSLGRGKCVTTGDGGVLLVHARQLAPFVAELRRPASGRGVGAWLAAAAVRACARPWVFDILSRIPGSAIGESHYDPGFAMVSETAAARGLAVDLGQAITRQLVTRTEVARMWLRALADSPLVSLVESRAGATPAYLRMPVFARDPGDRRRIAMALSDLGFRFVRSYPRPLSGVAEFHGRHCEARPTPQADGLASTVLVLPCHAGIRRTHVWRAAEVLKADVARDQDSMSADEESGRRTTSLEV